ncbi:MAG: NTP transferase domain-containing protein [Armatimonadota bacterium]|nr:NTP transferase domain-containing protein [Armatimonadota bacterium]
MQAVILAAGRGTRLRPITDHVPKPLIPFWGRPFIEYLLETLQGLVDEAIIVVPDNDVIRRRLGDRFGELPLRYACQPVPNGTGDAVLHARHLVEGPFLLNLGDTWAPRETMEALIESQADVVLTSIEVDDPEHHLSISTNGDARVIGLWTDATTVDAGVFRLCPEIFHHLDRLPPRGTELRVMQGIDALLRGRADVRTIRMPQPWLQFGDHEGLGGVLRVMRQMRDRIPGCGGEGDRSLEIATRDSHIANSLIFGPGEVVGCTIRDSLIYCARRIEGEEIEGEMGIRV